MSPTDAHDLNAASRETPPNDTAGERRTPRWRPGAVSTAYVVTMLAVATMGVIFDHCREYSERGDRSAALFSLLLLAAPWQGRMQAAMRRLAPDLAQYIRVTPAKLPDLLVAGWLQIRYFFWEPVPWVMHAAGGVVLTCLVPVVVFSVPIYSVASEAFERYARVDLSRPVMACSVLAGLGIAAGAAFAIVFGVLLGAHGLASRLGWLALAIGSAVLAARFLRHRHEPSLLRSRYPFLAPLALAPLLTLPGDLWGKVALATHLLAALLLIPEAVVRHRALGTLEASGPEPSPGEG